MDRMPKLVIHRDMGPDLAAEVVRILNNMPGGTTFCVDRLAGGSTRVWMSKRGYDYLQRQLQELRTTGAI